MGNTSTSTTLTDTTSTTTTKTTNTRTETTTTGAYCPEHINVSGVGVVSIIPSGWLPTIGDFTPVETQHYSEVAPHLRARGYFAENCTAGAYDNHQYVAWKLLGRQLRFRVDLSGAECGCYAAFNLVAMRQNVNPGTCFDHYCDAKGLCGESCAEISIMEANKLSWHSALHGKDDRLGFGQGFGGKNLDRKYFPHGACIDTTKPFDVSVSFPVSSAGHLRVVEVQLSQHDQYCPLKLQLGGYTGMAELSEALAAGMTPAISYWSSDDLLWMDGVGADHRDGCSKQKACSKMVQLDSFAIENMSSRKHSELLQMQESGISTSHRDSQGESASHADHTTPDTRRPPLCSRAWEQCGGLTWEGLHCCDFGSLCTYVNSTYSLCKLLLGQETDGLLEQSYSRNRVDDSSKAAVAGAATTDDGMSFGKLALFAAALGLCAIVVGFRAGGCVRPIHRGNSDRTLRAARHSKRASWHHSWEAAYTPI